MRTSATLVSSAVPRGDTDRVRSEAIKNDWNLYEVEGGEFDDENYLRNPKDRCFHCKTNLAAALQSTLELNMDPGLSGSIALISGANVDD